MNSASDGVLYGEMVCAVRSIELGVTDIERSIRFYTDAWRLETVATVAGVRYLRASGPEQYVLALREQARPALVAVEFAANTAADVDALAARLAATKGYAAVRGTALDRPGGGYGIEVRDSSGHFLRVSAGVAEHADAYRTPDRPYKISHVVLNSADRAADASFACDLLGFRVRDETRGMIFLGCNADHHSFAFAGGPDTGLNHVAYELESIDAIMRGAGRLKKFGHPMQWGIGRHGPGANVFSYYLDPDDFPIEYTAEIEQVEDATHRAGSPADWERPPFWDAWGQAEPPTERFRTASTGQR